jgi:hypothetical protein
MVRRRMIDGFHTCLLRSSERGKRVGPLKGRLSNPQRPDGPPVSYRSRATMRTPRTAGRSRPARHRIRGTSRT